MNQQRKEIQPEIESQVYAEDSLKSLENFVRELQGKVDNLDFEERRELLKLLVRSVTVKVERNNLHVFRQLRNYGTGSPCAIGVKVLKPYSVLVLSPIFDQENPT